MINYKEVIESRYNRQNWQTLLHDIFGSKIKFWSTPSTVYTSSQFAKQALWLGTITLSDEQTISVYEVELSDSVDIERNRRGIRDMLLTDWRNNGNAGAFMFCYRKNESVLRFSYVSESWTFAEDGSYQKESTDTKRFTYLLGEGHRSRTAQQQFEKLKTSALSLKDLTKAFSVDAVSDMFFNDYKKIYADIIFYITGKRMVKKGNKWEEVKEGRACRKILDEFTVFPDPEKAVRDYVKKLMGRLVFLQFLQKKGWMGVPLNKEWGEGDKEFVQNLFAKTEDKDHFIDNVLEKIFNDLNTEREDDKSKNYRFKIPYLNGGLFERDETDKTNFPLPAKYMQDMLDFFASYNFTIDENDPDDAEVGVDPEMLGRIFENLLEDNKDKGAFYTPKEIVSYMCRESLIAYLQTDIEKEEQKEAIRQFVTTHQFVPHLPSDTLDMLKNVKICDPAIGSGAFPMGLLKELYLCRTALEGIDQNKAAEIKKHIIQQNIYGVDIEKGAVDIARLRFWLSLIVDEETPQALPNLDFKIMQGNSLLEQYKGADLSTMTEKTEMDSLTFFDGMIDVYRKDLRKMLAEYYNCTDHKEKKSLRARIVDNVKQQLREQSINVDFGDFDLSGNNQFFLWHTWFYDVFSQGGFDIVIGNPPYGELRDLDEEEQQTTRLSKYYKYAKGGRINLFQFFYPLALDITRNGAISSFIVQNSLMAEETTAANRDLILNRACIRHMDSFPERYNVNKRVFKDVTMSVCICIVTKQIIDDYTFTIDVWNDKEMCDGKHLAIRKSEIVSLYPDSFILPSCTQESLSILIKIRNKANYHISAHAGEIDMTKFRPLFTQNVSGIRIITGSNIGSYFIAEDGSLGKNILAPVKILDSLQRLETIKKNRIVLQRITGVNAKKRFIGGMLSSSLLCANSTNYISSLDNQINLYYLLGVLNSRLMTYFDKLTNTNANITAKVLFNLPIVRDKEDHPIIDMVKNILEVKHINPSADTSSIESEIDQLVYQL
ncbi:MAG: N-6 DNA methylase, partial [Bacteroidaceae bacterium]|nr:N-6 DNA methylase [Bacteroidaceae bacterium]